MIIDAFLDALKDCAVALPFLFAVYLLMEALEKHSEVMSMAFVKKGEALGPLFSSVLGLIPQCGFSAAMSNLYVGGVIGAGTLISVFLATSDEALLIMLSHPGASSGIWRLLLVKFTSALVFGYLLNPIFKRWKLRKEVGDICTDEDCGCEESPGILRPALIHTLKIEGWLFGICFGLNILIALIGAEELATFIGGDLFIQPFITALLGLVPNCAVSVLFTELYLSGSLSFVSAVAGLCSGAGLGLIVLFRMNKSKKECVIITLTLYICSALTCIILNLIF